MPVVAGDLVGGRWARHERQPDRAGLLRDGDDLKETFKVGLLQTALHVQCLEQVFLTYRPAAIDRVYVVFVGPVEFLHNELEQMMQVRQYVPLSEPVAGLMAGALWREGILALSGTGSDVFLCAGEHKPRALRQNSRGPTVGGWGPLLGDQGILLNVPLPCRRQR